MNNSTFRYNFYIQLLIILIAALIFSCGFKTAKYNKKSSLYRNKELGISLQFTEDWSLATIKSKASPAFKSKIPLENI